MKADAGSGKLTVMGKLDPWKLRDRVEAKTHKKVDLVSPANFPKKGADANGQKHSRCRSERGDAAVELLAGPRGDRLIAQLDVRG